MSPSPRIIKGDIGGIYFLTLTVVEWINIFTTKIYFEVLKNSLQHCINNKSLILYEYVFMTNHIHLIASTDGIISLDDNIRDFKRFTTYEIKKLLEKDNRKYIPRLLKNSFKKKKDNVLQIWQRENYPVTIETEDFLNTKIEYIWNNPVKKGYVVNSEDWLYSSAKQKLLELKPDHPDVILPCREWEP